LLIAGIAMAAVVAPAPARAPAGHMLNLDEEQEIGAEIPPQTGEVTRPTTAPSRGKPVAIKAWLAQLAEQDAAVREAARAKLMALPRESLDDLATLVKGALPLQPSQVAVLREIVTQVYLSGEPYSGNAHFGFLGLAWQPDDEQSEVVEDGVVVQDRLAGFCGARALREGDVLMFALHPRIRLRTPDDLRSVVLRMKPGETLELQVLRAGKVIEVPIVLDALPMIGGGMVGVDQMRRERMEKADTYWERVFAPMVDGKVS